MLAVEIIPTSNSDRSNKKIHSRFRLTDLFFVHAYFLEFFFFFLE